MERVLPTVGRIHRTFKQKGAGKYELPEGTPLPAVVRLAQDSFWARQDAGIRRMPAKLHLESYTELPTGLQLRVVGDADASDCTSPSLLFRHTFGSFLIGAGHNVFGRLRTAGDEPLELAKIDDVFVHQLSAPQLLGLPSFLLAVKEVRKLRKSNDRRREAQIPAMPRVVGPAGLAAWLRAVYATAGAATLSRDVVPFLHTHELSVEPQLTYAERERRLAAGQQLQRPTQLVKRAAAPGVGGHWKSYAHHLGDAAWAFVFHEGDNTRFDPHKARARAVPESDWPLLKAGELVATPAGRVSINDVATTRPGRKIVVAGHAPAIDDAAVDGLLELAAGADLLVQPAAAAYGPSLAKKLNAKSVVLLPPTSPSSTARDAFACQTHIAADSWTFDLPEKDLSEEN